ncbi:hypothetical protein GCM10009676_05360 [Prauserella halophila]|uniref:Ferredoxin n=1 Tax=Prauserella halophila TaxID=185641 RepID=A0ABN1VZ93_9PSEU|nr:ferredoxin [Prauserella halophila]MCP2237415.1 hypothetical protein [Prauserella halophila]
MAIRTTTPGNEKADRPEVRPDVRLETAPMVPVSCESCGITVEARKSSWEQTSIQWHGDLDGCLERRAAPPPTIAGTAFRGCTALRNTLSHAVDRGALPVLTESE